MGSNRTSNKDILAAINANNDAIKALVAAITGQVQVQAPAQVATPKAPTVKAEPTLPEVDKSYQAHMEAKVQGLVSSDGQARVLYIRKNGKGEVKLAYCLADKWTSLRDNGMIGAVAIYE